MSKFKDITGQRFGRLIALYPFEEDEKREGKKRWICQCDCGNKTNPISGTHLRSGRIISCGCYKIEKTKKMGERNKKENIYLKINDATGYCYSPDGEKYLYEFSWETRNLIQEYCWSIGTRNYIHSRTKDENDKIHLIQLHRLIMSSLLNVEYSKLKRVDHIDNDPQNNKIKNLRPVTHSQNMMNRKLNKNNKTGTKGVEITKNGKYIASITVNKKVIPLGTYLNIEDARNARIQAELEYFGEYSNKSLYESDTQ